MRRPKTVLLWLATLAAPFVFMALMDAWFAAIAPPEDKWRIASAPMLISHADTPHELPESGWRTLRIPHRVPTEGSYPSSAWYRIPLHVSSDARDTVWAVYIPRPYGNYVAFVNGQRVGDGGSTRSPVPLHLSPVIFHFPGALLHEGENRVELRVLRDLKHIGMSTFSIGPDSELMPQYKAAFFVQSTLKSITVVCMLAMSALMLALFTLRTRDASLAWFALALTFWAAHIAVQLVPTPPFDIPYLWLNLGAIALGAFVVCSALFVHRFLGMTRRKLELAAVAWFAAGATVLVIDSIYFDYSWPWFFGQVWFRPILLLGAYVTWQLIRAHRRQPEAELMALTAAAWFELVIGVRDGLVQNEWIRFRPFYLTYTVGPVLLTFGFVLLHRFTRAVNEIAEARDELELRVREKTTELEFNLGRIKDMERERALTAERERIMRDVQDGVGDQLVHALSMAAHRPELGAIKEPLENCLLELRMIIDSLEPTQSDLTSVLSTLRTRLSKRLAAAGVAMHWDVGDLPSLSSLGPMQVLQISRIVQEAIANTLKHSNATAIQVSAHLRDDAVSLELADDGGGFEGPAEGGRGLHNMRTRATEVGGHLAIESSPKGTVVRLRLPVRQDAAQQPPDASLAFAGQPS